MGLQLLLPQLLHTENHRINLIDTPGHVDFTVEVSRSLRVLDGAITVLDAQAGVEPQTETVWRQATDYHVPRIIYVNKMDKIGANFNHAVSTVERRLGVKAYPIQVPIGAEADFKGIVDIVAMKAYEYYLGDPDETNREIPIPEYLMDEVLEKRENLISAVADYDEEVMMLYLDGQEIPYEVLKRAIRKATLTVKFFPVLCGTAFKNKGIKLVLDAVIDYLPSPIDIPPMKGVDKDGNEVLVHSDDNEPFTALAFKVMTDPYVGKLTYFRVYSGTLSAGSYVYNATKGKKRTYWSSFTNAC